MSIRKNKKNRYKKRFVSIYTSLLIIFSGYFLMDTFVLEKTYSNVMGSLSTNTTNTSSDNADNTSQDLNGTQVTKDSYSDLNKTINIKEYTKNNTKIYVADIYLKNNSSIKTALANDIYGKNVVEKTSEMASNNSAILAINGDYYGSRNSGYVVRNGQILRSESSDEDQEDLVIYKDGSMKIIREGDISAEKLVENGAVQVLSFGPGLIEDGKIIVDSSDEVGKAMASNPRTAIGMISENHYVMVVSDGRTEESEGMTLLELASFMKELGVTTAYNLDGGGSSTMYFNGSIVNKPTTNGSVIKERSVSDIVYI